MNSSFVSEFFMVCDFSSSNVDDMWTERKKQFWIQLVTMCNWSTTAVQKKWMPFRSLYTYYLRKYLLALINYFCSLLIIIISVFRFFRNPRERGIVGSFVEHFNKIMTNKQVAHEFHCILVSIACNPIHQRLLSSPCVCCIRALVSGVAADDGQEW